MLLHPLNLLELIWKHRPQQVYMNLKRENSELWVMELKLRIQHQKYSLKWPWTLLCAGQVQLSETIQTTTLHHKVINEELFLLHPLAHHILAQFSEDLSRSARLWFLCDSCHVSHFWGCNCVCLLVCAYREKDILIPIVTHLGGHNFQHLFPLEVRYCLITHGFLFSPWYITFFFCFISSLIFSFE